MRKLALFIMTVMGAGNLFATDVACIGTNCTGVDQITLDPRSAPTVTELYFVDGTTQTTAGGAGGGGGGSALGTIVNNGSITQISTLTINVPASMGNTTTATSSRTINIFDQSKTTNTTTAQKSFTQRVGIGTVNPADTLHVIKLDDGQGNNYGLSLGNANSIHWADGPGPHGTSQATIQGSTITQTITISAAGAQKIVAKSGGVGIGAIATVSSILDVDGGSITSRGTNAGLATTGNAAVGGSVRGSSATFSGTVTTTDVVKGKSFQFADGTIQTTADTGGSPTFNSFYGGKSTGPHLDMNGFPIINQASSSYSGPGPAVISSTNPFYLSGSSGTIYLSGSSTTITLVQQTSTTTFRLEGGEMFINNVKISTDAYMWIPLGIPNGIGVATATVANSTWTLGNGRWIADFRQSTAGSNYHEHIFQYPPKVDTNLPVIIQQFTMLAASGTVGNGMVANFNPHAQRFVATLSTFSANDLTNGNVQNVPLKNNTVFTVPGSTNTGAATSAMWQTMNNWSTQLGGNGGWATARFLADKQNPTSIQSIFLGGLLGIPIKP